MTRTRKFVLFLLLLFVLYAIITNPTQAAAFVQTAFVYLAAAVSQIFAFFGALLR